MSTAMMAALGFSRTSLLAQPPEVPETPGPYSLPQLPYDFAALEPSIDARTMEIHYTKHHKGYVSKLNKALEDAGYDAPKSPAALIRDIRGLPKEIQTAVRHNGGGHVNHSLFWEVMSPKGGGEPEGPLADAIDEKFGSFREFKKEFTSKAKGVFGSGWAWLAVNRDGELFVTKTANQNNPLMNGIVKEPGAPILGLDVWEHAYYLKYQSSRGKYIDNFWKVVDWSTVQRYYDRIKQGFES